MICGGRATKPAYMPKRNIIDDVLGTGDTAGLSDQITKIMQTYVKEFFTLYVKFRKPLDKLWVGDVE